MKAKKIVKQKLIKNLAKYFMSMFIIIGICFFSSCSNQIEGSSEKTMSKEQHKEGKILFNLWQVLTSELRNVKQGYGLYTYVFGNCDDEKLHRLHNIIAGTSPIDTTLMSNIGQDQYNLFLLPDSCETNYKIRMAFETIYFYETHYVDSADLQKAESLTLSFSNRRGPFLVSIHKPIHNYIENIDTSQNGDNDFLFSSPIFYVDLSDFNIGGLEELVASYKDQIIEREISNIEKFRSLKLSLLDKALDLNDYILLAKVNILDWVE